MTFLEYFTAEETRTETHSWIKATHIHVATSNALIQLLADKIMQHHFRGSPHLYRAWKQRVDGGPPHNTPIQHAIEAFVDPIFGLPTKHANVDHVEGYVGEMMWYFVVREIPSDEPIVRIEPPSFKSTDAGGDALIVHRLPIGYLMFRLWEMKKCSGNSSNVSSTVSGAYNQLEANAMEYLARYSVIAQETDDTELSEFYGQLVELWDSGSPKAAAGISVATSTAHVPTDCFSTFGERFPHFTIPVRLKGMLTSVGDFTTFVEGVRDFVWTGL